jgi:hypothetical protein
MRRVLFAGITSTLVACALTTDLSGYAGNAVEVPAEGSTGDAPGADAVPPGTDGGGTAADAGPFCAGWKATTGAPPIWCRDFDDGTPLSVDFVPLAPSPGGKVEIDNATSVSAPAALFTRLEQGATGCSYARTIRMIAAPPKVTRFAFDVRLGGPGVDPMADFAYYVLSLGPDGETDRCNLILLGNNAMGGLYQQFGSLGESYHPLSTWPKHGAWHHVQLDVNRDDLTVDAYVDGVHAFDKPQSLDPRCAAVQPIVIQSGVFCESTPVAPMEVRFDNMVVSTP